MQRRLFTTLSLGVATVAAAPAFASSGRENGQDIVLGQVASLSGPDGADLGLGLKLGIEACFNTVNTQGGIAGRKVRLISMDDKYVADETVRLTREILEKHKPVGLLGYRGTANTLALIKSGLLETFNTPLLGTLSGAQDIQGAPMIYHLRTSYPNEIKKLVQQMQGIGLSKIGLLYVDDAFGQTGRDSVLEVMAASKSKLHVEAAYDKAPAKVAMSIASAVNQIVAAQPQAVVIVAVGNPVYAFVQACRAKAASIQLFSLSVVSPALVIEKVGLEAAKGMGFSQVFPYPYADSTPLVREYRKSLSLFAPKAAPSYFSLEGFVYAKVMAETIRLAAPNLTAGNIKTTLGKLPSYDLGGFGVSFDAVTHNGSKFSDLSIISSTGKLIV